MLRLPKKGRSTPEVTRVNLKPSVDLSFTAVLYVAATLFIGIAAMNSQTNLLFGVFGLMVGVLMVAGYISRIVLRKLTVRRIMPELLVVGEPANLSYSITNAKSHLPSISVSLGELDGCESFVQQPYSYLLHVAPGMTTEITEPICPRRRGLCELNRYQLSTSFPFGFIVRALVFEQKDTVVVFPALARVDGRVLGLCQSAEKSGASIRPRKGGDDEFYGLREYRMGENPRLIHWRRTAHTGTVVMREMTQVSPPRILIILDAHRKDDSPEQLAETERAIAVAASLASYALEQGHPVGLFTRSGEAWVQVSPSRGKRHRREMLTQLARLAVLPNQSLANLLDASLIGLGEGTTAIVVTTRPAEHVPADRGRRRVVTLSTRDAQTASWFMFADTVDFSAKPAAKGTSSPSQPAPVAPAEPEVTYV